MSMYLPSELINSDYKYDLLENNHIIVYSNNKCNGLVAEPQYYFKYEVMPEFDYNYNQICAPALSEGDVNLGTKLNADNGHVLLLSGDFTSDEFYRIDILNILLIFTILYIFIIHIPFKIFSRILGRWLKV